VIDTSLAYQDANNRHARTPNYRVVFKPVDPHGLTPGLVSYWGLDQTSGPRWDYHGLHHMSAFNDVGYRTGKFSNAASFVRPSGQYLETSLVSNDPLILGDIATFTVTCWVILNDKADRSTIISQAGPGTATTSFLLRYDLINDRFRFAVTRLGTGETFVHANNLGSPAINTWYFIAAKFRADKYLQISVNGGTADVSATTGGPPNATTEPYRIGCIFNPGATDFMSGAIDEIGFWKRELSDAEILQLYNNGFGRSYDQLFPPAIEFHTHDTIYGEKAQVPQLLAPISLQRQVDIDIPHFPLTVFTFLLYDIDSAITDLLSETDLVGAGCELWTGFYDKPSTSHSTRLWEGLVTEIINRTGRYEFIARSVLVTAQEQVIFGGAQSRLTVALNTTATTITVEDASAFDRAGDLPYPARRIVNVENEIMVYRGKSGNNLTDVIRATTPYFIPPAFPFTENAAHGVGASVRELVSLGIPSPDNNETTGTINDQHPIDYIYMVLTNTDSKYGIGIAAKYVNNEELQAAKIYLGGDIRFRFLMTEAVNAKQWLEEEIYLPLAAYPTEDEFGRIGIKFYQGSADAVYTDNITDDHVFERPQWIRNAEKQINTVVYHYDHHPISGEFTSTYIYRDDTLVLEHGREMPIHIFSKGIRAYAFSSGVTWFFKTAQLLQNCAMRHVERFGRMSPVIRYPAVLSKNLLELGDDVRATFSEVVDLPDGAREVIDSPMEIMSSNIHFETNTIEMQLVAYPDEAPTLIASPASITVGGTITAFWSRVVPATTTDWIGLYRPAMVHEAVIDYFYTSSCTKTPGANALAAGSCALVLPGTLTPGPYQLRLFTNDSLTVLDTSNTFTVI